jgi:hypothetical protein
LRQSIHERIKEAHAFSIETVHEIFRKRRYNPWLMDYRTYLWVYSALGVALVGLGFLVVSLNTEPALASAVEANLAACQSIPNLALQRIREHTKVLIIIPKELYPNQRAPLPFTPISGNATATYVEEGRPPRRGSGEWCYGAVYRFEGTGEIDLIAKSARFGVPDYKVRFLISATPSK